MFRAVFHSSFLENETLRFFKKDLDGAYDSNEYSQDFFIDLIFKAIKSNPETEKDNSD